MLEQLQKPKILCSKISMLVNEVLTRRAISAHSSVGSVAMPPVLRTVTFLFQFGGNIRDIKYKIRQPDVAAMQIFIYLTL